MHADAHFVIGQAHVTGGKPCQDYAASGELPDSGAYAIVSDGCSSGGRTDVGARLVALATAQELRHATALLRDFNPTGVDLEAIRLAVNSRQRFSFETAPRLLGLDQDDLLATCVYAYAHEGIRFIGLHGDGVVAEMFADGHIGMTRFDWHDNAPAYPVYMLDNYADFISFHGGDIYAEKLAVTHYYTRDPDSQSPYNHQQWALQTGIEGAYWQPNPESVKLAVFTDGVTQIEGIDWKDAVAELMNFKSTTGEFAKRRLNRFVRDSHKVGRGPIDDLAYAVIDLTSSETDAPKEAS